MTEMQRLLRRSDPERLVRESVGLAALCVLILVGLFVPSLA